MFFTDLRRTFQAWRAQPLLPLTVLALSVGFVLTRAISGPISVLVLLALPLSVGFLGAQRIWYARAWEGRKVSLREAFELSVGLLVEYLALGLLMILVGMLVAVPVYVQFGRTAGIVAHLVAVDLLFTFATSAVAVGDEAAGEALTTSWRLLRRGFPRCLPHALLPPMVLYGLVQDGGWLFVGADLVALVARGVTTSYYLRATAPPPVPEGLEVKRNPVMFH